MVVKRINRNVKKYFSIYSWKRILRHIKKDKVTPKIVDQTLIKNLHLKRQKELLQQKNTLFHQNIKFSIITPLYNTPEKFLIELIKSVQNQTYSNWELCLADGSDTEHQYVKKICEELVKNDSRIVYKKLLKNGGISENTNECLKLSTGEYIGLLDHDDMLHPSALFEIAKVVEGDKADFIYTDEVKFKGKVEDIQNPLDFNLKPGFGKYDLRSHNYICHFTVFSRKLLADENELFRKEYDGSQDHDMVLRLTEKAKKIVHIPQVLYYWRVHENSVAMDLGTKIYAVDAAINAVKAQLERENEKGRVKSNLPFQTIYRISYDIKNKPLVSIILYDNNNVRGIQKKVQNIINKTSYRPIEVISFSKKVIKSAANKDVNYIFLTNCENMKRSQMWNMAVKKSNGEHIIIMSSQCVPENTNWLEEMVMLSQKSDVCAVGPKIWLKDGTIGYAGVSLWKNEKTKLKFLCQNNKRGDIGYEALLCHVRHTTATIASCMMFSKDVWEELGGFSEKFSEYGDIDFCIRGLKRGKANLWTCFAELVYMGKNINTQMELTESEEFSKEYEDYFVEENCYHPAWEILELV